MYTFVKSKDTGRFGMQRDNGDVAWFGKSERAAYHIYVTVLADGMKEELYHWEPATQHVERA